MSGHAEHTSYMGKGCVVSINVGLKGAAVKGNKWHTHRKTLLDIFVAALIFSSDMIGMLVAEVGAVTDPYDENDRNRFDDLFKEAFRTADARTGASEHNEKLKIFGRRGTGRRR